MDCLAEDCKVDLPRDEQIILLPIDDTKLVAKKCMDINKAKFGRRQQREPAR